MEEIVWEACYNTGIDEIDRQHRQLITMLNTLVIAKKSGQEKRIVRNVIQEMSEYTSSHFAFEEELMKISGYRYLKPHQNIHQAFIKKVDGFTHRFDMGEDIVEEFYSLLRIWLLQHIQQDDANGYGVEVKDKMMEVLSSKVTNSKGKSWLAQKLHMFFGD